MDFARGILIDPGVIFFTQAVGPTDRIRAMQPSRPASRRSIVFLTIGLLVSVLTVQAHAQSGAITALGRLEPADGVIRVSGPSLPAVVITELLVDEGDVLEAGQPIARLDTYARHRANVEAMRARLEGAQRELDRASKLRKSRATAIAQFDEATTDVKVAKAELAGARADLARSEVKSPSAGRVLLVHTRAGERVGPDGILELGRTDQMYAIAEVYETDIGTRVSQGDAAKHSTSAASSTANPVR